MNRKANRYKDYKYSSQGYYFVTICTKDRLCYFGKTKDGKMILNKYGEIAGECWLEIPEHFSNIRIDEFVVMPNHFHGIIIIDDFVVGYRHACSLQNTNVNRSACSQQNGNDNRRANYLQNVNENENENRQHQKLPVVIGSFKSAVSKLIHRKYDNNFQWQKSYYDHIIRNESSLNKIKEYIRKNPQSWDTDKNNLLFRSL